MSKGKLLWFEATAVNIVDEHDENTVVVTARDISTRKSLEEDLRHKVLHDDLTGIANRVLYRERLEHALSMRRSGSDVQVAALFIDIDDFKTVNDGLGHDVGDELLKVVAFRLASNLRESDTAARLGGDEFAVLIERPQNIEEIMSTAHRILQSILLPVEFGDRELKVGASIGVAIAGVSDSAEMVLRNADVAMYHAKQTGKNRVKLFDQEMYIGAFERLELKAELAYVLDREELSVYYQPIVDFTDQRVCAFEALLRWTHPTRGFVSPSSFVPLLEETGLIVAAGKFILRSAIEQMVQWRSQFGHDVRMNVNISPRQLQEEHIVSEVADLIAEFHIDPAMLTLELTESSGLHEDAAVARLVGLSELGCVIAADDFGTGFASYASLRELPFNLVKIDRSLVAGLSRENESAIAQLRSIIDMAHALGMKVTAEGVEDDAQAEVLIALGSDYAQGSFFGRAAPAPVAANFLERIVAS